MTKCDYCGLSVSTVNAFRVQYHWSYPKEVVFYCKQCCEKKGLEWTEYEKGDGKK